MNREYKKSGIELVGYIPKDWDVLKMRNIGVFSSSGIDKKVNENEQMVKIVNYVDVYKNPTMLLNNKDYMIVSTTPEKIKKHTLKEGDLIFTPSSETVDDIGISALVNENLHNTAFSYHLLRFQFNRQVFKEYKKYLCNNYYVQQYFSSRATGSIRKTLKRSDFNELKIVLPPIEQQKKISIFLDNKINQINEIIDKTTISIEEYKKYKYALITKCVTKGINKNVNMKSTNIDWIGEIPKEWNCMKLKYIFSIKKDIAGKEGFDILSVTQSGLKIKDISKNEGQIALDYSKYQIVEKGDFVMNHMDLLTGWVDCSKYYGVTSPDYRVFKFKNPELYSPEYYTYIMQICYKNKIFYGLGQGVSNLGRWRLQTDKFLNFVLPVPPKEEQERIVDYLDKKCIEIDNIIKQKQKLLVEMESYKKSLIYECVTGKREVE